MNYPSRTKNGQLQVFVYGHWRKAKKATCIWCDEEFIYPLTDDRKGLYCSQVHAMRAVNKWQRSQRIRKRCPICLTFFKVPPNRVSRYRTCGLPECKSEIKRRITTERHRVEGPWFGHKVK